MVTTEQAAEKGGAGGKFRKRPFRRSATPYDRPPTSLRAATTGNGGWISKLVDPASKLITSGANRLFASVFRKRLPASPVVQHPPPPPHTPPQESNQTQRNTLQGAFLVDPPRQESNAVEGSSLYNISDGSGIVELEQILKQKTFTRSQIDRLTELLHARTLDESRGNTEKKPESDVLELVSGRGRQDRSADIPVKENGIESQRLLGVPSTPGVTSKVFEDDVASPAELAKAYMVSRPSKVSPSMLGFRSQVFNEDATLLSDSSKSAFPSKLSIMSPAPRSSFHTRLPDNGFMTPRSHSRSSIYRMTRTPYSRALPMAVHMGHKSTIDGYGGPASSSSQNMWEQNGLSDSLQVGLKRRSSVLDDDIRSVGPVRRIRQKSNLLSEKRLSLSVSGASLSIRGTSARSDAGRPALPSTQGPLLLDESEHKTSKMVADDGGNCFPGTGFSSVPSQSRETAAKILQQLNLLVSSPLKEKSPELKLAAARETSPGKLTTDMLRGRALRSEENVDTSKFLQSVEDNMKLDSSCNGCLPDVHSSVSQKQGKVEENGLMNFVAPCEREGPAVRSLYATVPIEDSVRTRTSDSAFSVAVANSSQKKLAFKMSAHEDHLDLDEDDDDFTHEAAPAVVAEGNGKLDTCVGSKASAAEAVRVEKTPYEAKAPTNIIMNIKADLGTSDASVVTEKNASFTFPPPSAPTTTVRSTSLVSQFSSAFNPVVTPKEPSAAPPLFSFGSGNVNSVPAIKFSSPSSVDESPQSTSAALNPKPESSISFASVAAEPVQKILESHKGGDQSVQKDDELISKPDIAASFVASSSTPPSSAASPSPSTTSTFSFGVNANKSSINNGSLSSSSIFSSPTLPVSANSLNNQFFNGSLSAVSTISTTTTMSMTSATPPGTGASSSSISSTSAAPLSPSALIFKFGSSAAPSTAASPALVTSVGETAVLEDKTKTTQEKSFGSQTTAFSFSGPAAGSSTIGFGTPSSSTANNNQSLGSAPFGTGPSSQSGVAASSESKPIQFGSSAASPILSFASGSSPFSSSSSATNMFSSGLSLAAPVTEPCANGSALGTTSSSSGSSWLSTKSPVFGSTFNSTSPSVGFSFGSSSASAPSNSAPMVFGSSNGASSGSMFSFTSAAATTQPVFGNSNSVSAFGSTPTGSNDNMNMEDSMAEDNSLASTPAFPAFGQPPVTPSLGFMFGSTAPPGPSPFQFGGQQNQATPLNPNPFQSSGSLDFSAGGSFSLGSGGTNKSNRKMIKVRRKK